MFSKQFLMKGNSCKWTILYLIKVLVTEGSISLTNIYLRCIAWPAHTKYTDLSVVKYSHNYKDIMMHYNSHNYKYKWNTSLILVSVLASEWSMDEEKLSSWSISEFRISQWAKNHVICQRSLGIITELKKKHSRARATKDVLFLCDLSCWDKLFILNDL